MKHYECFYRIRPHLKPSLRRNQKLIYIILGSSFFLGFLIFLTAINIRYGTNDGHYSFQDLYYIMITNNIFGNHANQLVGINESSGAPFAASNFIDLAPVKRALWISIATALAGIGLAIAGSITQGLTHNPIADPTTFGITEASIFGAVLMNVLVGSYISPTSYQYVFVLFAFLGGAFSVFFILLLINSSNKRQTHYLKITLAGLGIAIFFRMINYLLRSTNTDAAKTAFAAAIGGAENIYALYPSQFSILGVGIVLILICLIVTIGFARNLTILELGDRQAKSLGVDTRVVKTIGLLLILITVPISITLVGNVAFVGLFAPHIIRMLFKTRNYGIIVPLAALLGGVTMSLGLTMSNFLKGIPSSIYMVFIGAPMLIYLG